ncbi:hypothetical protein B0F90DRAFT_1724733 [Multifurca ochricompacta]|uniref:RNA-binding S4 domain-containing protein n=1 Tax=Multifurca ochricompacta TaxID=376703 RepID=A0AAD4M2V7_9AGAM|nr:hypothetical protein B0F90DRAFT_1724733 [Multifurca ochricompacta]
MRDLNLYNFKRALPRMSWTQENLYNLWRRSLGELANEADFTRTQKTLFQQRWIAKRLVRAYHGDFINEKTFKHVRPRWGQTEDYATQLNKWAKLSKAVDKDVKARRQEIDGGEQEELPPVGSLMFSEVERRIDVVIFRACMAHSVYDARRMVVHGQVLLNGKKHQNANTRLAPGDMVSVDPKVISFLQPKVPSADMSSEELAADEPKVVTSAYSTPNPSSSQPQSSNPIHDKSLTPFQLPAYASPFIFIPAYLEVSFATCSVVYVRHPTARPGYSEIPTPYDADGEVVRLAWEWYSKVRPRNRSKRQLAREPENRQ